MQSESPHSDNSGLYLTRGEAESLTEKLKPYSFFLDDPGWHHGFEDLIDLWEAERKGHTLPTLFVEHLLDIPGLLPMTSVVKLPDNADDLTLNFSYMGAELETYISERPGVVDYADSLESDQQRQFMADYISLKKKWPHPYWCEGSIKTMREGPITHERLISVPGSTDGKVIDCTISVSVFLDSNGNVVSKG